MKHTLASLRIAPLAIFTFVALAAFAVPATADVSGSVSSSVSPAGRDIGLGVEFGAPTSINLKLMTASNQGVVFGIGGGIWYDASLSLHADYLWHPLIANFNDGTFSAFIGGGLWASVGYEGSRFGYYRPYGNGGPVGFGARLPLGLAVAFNQVPVEVFVEVVPSLALFPGIGAFGQGGIGARFYF